MRHMICFYSNTNREANIRYLQDHGPSPARVYESRFKDVLICYCMNKSTWVGTKTSEMRRDQLRMTDERGEHLKFIGPDQRNYYHGRESHPLSFTHPVPCSIPHE